MFSHVEALEPNYTYYIGAWTPRIFVGFRV